LLIATGVARDARLAGGFYQELLRLKIEPEVAKDLTIAYIVRITGEPNVIQ
jgi:hypothetical protein